jgi:hypothetical protein
VGVSSQATGGAWRSAAVGVDQEGAAAVDPQPPGALGPDLDVAQIGARRHQDVVFELAGPLPHPHVDPGVQAAVEERPVGVDAGAPLGRVVAEGEVVHAGPRPLADQGRPPGAVEGEGDRRTVGSGQADGLLGEGRRHAAFPGDEPVLGRPLAGVLDEVRGENAQPGPSR